jgi:hypothetical protein
MLRTGLLLRQLAPDINCVTEMTTPGLSPSFAMRLLEAGIPLSLLCDLAASEGPDSTVICARERLGG